MNRRQAWRARLGAWVAAALACGAAQAAEPAVALRVPAAAELPWRGLAGAEAAGAAGAILYPVPGLVGLLAAVFTHGAVVEGTRSAQRSKQQEAADQVLEPYRSALATWTPRALLDATATRLGGGAVRVLASDTEADAEEWLVEISPSFAITPDHATVLLDNTVRVTRASVPGGPRFENTVRVLSAPLVPADARGHWSDRSAASTT